MSENKVYDVLVIGCGPAGIAAGIEFEKSKTNYLILEGRNRVGGRAFTDEITFGRECPVDLGAHFLSHHQQDNFLFQNYTKSEKDSILTDQYDPSVIKIVDQNGKSVSNDLISQSIKFLENLFEFISHYSQHENKDISVFDLIDSKIENIDNKPMQELVRLFLSYTERHEASDLNQLSTLFFGKAEGNIEYTNLAITDGLGNLIRQIADKYQLRIQLNSIVSLIDATNEFVKVKTNDHQLYQCRYVLLTVPLGCLKKKSIEFYPSLPQWKENAIETMGFGLYISGSFAREIEQLSDKEIIDDIIKSLKTIYPNVTYPIKWLITRWSQDPFANGSYSTFYVGNDFQTIKDLARQTHEGKIHWAGEHTNFDGCIGYVDSGFESGFREGKLIIEKFSFS